MAFTKNRDEPIYTISIAAKLVRPTNSSPTNSRTDGRARARQTEEVKPIHAQTLRMYDRLGLVKPRKVGKNRFYSDRDIERLQQIQHLTQEMKVNLTGVAYIISLLDQLQQMDALNERLEAMLRVAEQQAALVDLKRATTKAGNDED